MNKTLSLFSIAASTLLLSGCFSVNPGSMNNHAMKVSQQDVMGMTDGSLSKSVREITVKKESIDISTQKTLKIVLRELQNIDNNIYMLDKNAKNIDIPINSKYKIDSYSSLIRFLETTTDYTLVMKDNKYRKDLPKIIDLVHKKSVQLNIDKHSIPIEIKSANSSMTAKDALVTIAKEIKFSVVFKHIDFPETKMIRKEIAGGSGTSMNSMSGGMSGGMQSDSIQGISIFDNAIINFYGNTLSDFFHYIEDSFDVFVDVDYEKKQILISKLKTNVIKLSMPNIEIDSQNNASEGAATTGGFGADDGGEISGDMIQSTISIKMYEQLQDKLDKVFGSSSGASGGSTGGMHGGSMGGMQGGQQLEYFDIDVNNGEILIVSGREKLERARKAIESFNESYSKIVFVDFRVYEVLVYADSKLGVGVGGEKSGFNFLANPEVNGFMNYVAKASDSLSLDTTLESLHSYGHILKGYKASVRMIDNIPKSIQLTTSDDYISNITNNLTTTTGTINTETSNTTSTLKYGRTITLKPKTYDNEAVIEINYENSGKPNLKDRTIGNDTIQISENKTKDKYRDIVKLKNKETVIVNVIEEFVSADDYSGVVPLENFIIGGNKKNEYVKKEIIFILSLTELKDK